MIDDSKVQFKRYDSYDVNHIIIKLMSLSLVQTSSLMTSHDDGITAVSAQIFAFRSLNFSEKVIYQSHQSERDGILCDFTWFFWLQMTYHDLMLPQMKFASLSRSMNRSVIESLTVIQAPLSEQKLHLSSQANWSHHQILWLDEILTNESLTRVKPYSQVLK